MKATSIFLANALFMIQMGHAQTQQENMNGDQHFVIASEHGKMSQLNKIVENKRLSGAETYDKKDIAFADSKVSLGTADLKRKSGDMDLNLTTKNTVVLPEVYNTYLVDPNSEFSGFGPAYYKDELVFASDRNTERPIYSETQRPFLDLYEAKIENGHMTNETLFSSGINTDIHESNAAFTPDGKTMYFTRNSDKFKRINGRKTAVLQIFRAELANGKWGNIKPLSISSNVYSVAHPSLSADGKTLYFSSDMPGGSGGSDIYKVAIIKGEKLGEPVNLGTAVNSEMQEQFPFISENGNLYFASDRKTGYGGLDIYQSQSKNNTFSPARNLGSTINGATDDFSLITKENQGTGYFSSNRTGKDKIYRFDKEKDAPVAPMVSINGQTIQGDVTDVFTGASIIGVKVSLLKPDGTLLRQTIVNPDGSFEIAYDEDGDYKLEYSEWQYKKSSININWTRTNTEALKLSLTLEPKHKAAPLTPKNTPLAPKTENTPEVVKETIDLKKLQLDNIYFGFDKSNIDSKAAKKLDELAKLLNQDKNLKINIGAYADKSGSENYNHGLSKRRANAAISYLTAKGITEKRLTFHAYGESKAVGEGDQAKNRKCEFKIMNIK